MCALSSTSSVHAWVWCKWLGKALESNKERFEKSGDAKKVLESLLLFLNKKEDFLIRKEIFEGKIVM